MSYASVVANNSAPADQLPKPNPSLLEGGEGGTTVTVGEKPSENTTGSTFNSNELGTKRTREEASAADKRKNKDDSNASEPRSPKKQKSSPPSSSKDTKKRDNNKDPTILSTGLVTGIHLIVLGGLGFFSYRNWNRSESWNKKIIGGLVVGVGSLLGIQTYFMSFCQRKK